MIRLQASTVRVTQTRMRVVVIGANEKLRHTSVLPVIVAPGNGCHAVPVQYCTSKSCSPYFVNVIVGVGGLGNPSAAASCRLKTSSLLIVFVPLNATSTQSGKA